MDIVISDTGCGIPEAHLSKIFDPFYTTRRGSGGTGLGLAIAYKLVEEHGGVISVTSKLDVGTTFSITLPVRPAAASGGAGQP